MANNIKGITVEIGGDTTPLNNALKGANDEITKTQKELKEVNRQLKFDPTNTELVKQKQKLLGDEIKNTKGKLVTLKEAEKQAQDQFKQGKISEEQYRALQREVIKTESQLKKLEKQAKNTNSVLGKKFEAAGGKISAAGDKISGVGKKMMPATLAIAGIGGAAVKMGGDYEDSLAKVSTIADTSKKSIEDLSGEVMSLSDKTGTSADEINEALYQAISAGADTEKATGLVEVAVKSAKGGFTDTATAVDGLTSVLNTYGMKTEDADKLANQFLITQNLGKTTFGELAGSIGKVAPTASAAGVKTNELLSSIAALTANGISTSESVTGMKAALSNIIKPSKAASDVAKTLGLDFSATALQSKGLGGFMAELKEKTGGNLDTMSKLFGSTEALNTALTLTSDSGMGTMNKTMQEMETNTTAVDDAFDKVNGTTSNSMKKTINEIKNQAIEIGQMIMPIIKQIMEKISGIVKKFSSLSPATKEMILKIALIVAAVAPLLIIGGKVTTAVGNITKGTGKLIKGVGKLHGWIGEKIPKAISLLMANPMILIITGVVAAVALLVIGIKHLWDTNEGFRTAVTNIWGGIKAVIGGVVNAIVGFFTITIPNAWNGLVAFFTGVPEWWNDLWTQVGQFFSDCWNGIISFFTDTIPTWIQSVGDWFNQLPHMIGEAIGAVLACIVNFGVDAWNWVTVELPKIIMGIVGWFGQLPGKIWAFLVDIVAKIGQWGTNIWIQATIVVPKFINTVTTFFSELPGKIWAFLVDVVTKVVEWAGNLVTTAQTEIPKFVSKVMEFIGELPEKMLDIGKNIVHGIWDGINGAVDWLHDRIKGFCNGIVDGFKEHLKIHSPSVLFADVIGKNLALGIGQGFTDNMKSVVSTMASTIPTHFDTGVKVRTAMAAAYGNYPINRTNSNNHSNDTKEKSTQGNGPVTVNQYFQGKTPTPAEHSRQTRNSVKQALLELRK